jgi:RNA 2',3'-cyclic 3'-phosphodiesterase
MMLRSFIAVEVPPEVQNAISQSLAPLQKSLPKPLIRWVAPQNVHLTLKFLGDVSPINLEQMAEAIRFEAEAHQAFSMSVAGIGAFPNSRRPRVIWIGLAAPAALTALQRGVEAASASLGYAAENRPFSPHLTVGRVGQAVSVSDLHKIHLALEEMKVGQLGQVQVTAIHIFKSDLRPGGSVYTPLYVLPMKPLADGTTDQPPK